MNFDLAQPLLVEARRQTDRWSRTRSPRALRWLVANDVWYSEPEAPNSKNAVGWFGEFAVACATGYKKRSGGVALSLPDIIVPGRGHDLEVKATCGSGGWRLGKFLFNGKGKRPGIKADYVVLRVDIANGWRITEAWRLPLAVVERWTNPPNHYLSAHDGWRRERRVQPLVLGR